MVGLLGVFGAEREQKERVCGRTEGERERERKSKKRGPRSWARSRLSPPRPKRSPPALRLLPAHTHSPALRCPTLSCRVNPLNKNPNRFLDARDAGTDGADARECERSLVFVIGAPAPLSTNEMAIHFHPNHSLRCLPRRPPSLLLMLPSPPPRPPQSRLPLFPARAGAGAPADEAAPASTPPPPKPTELSTLQKNVYRHTLTSLYVAPEDRVPDIPAVDWEAKRKRRERSEIAEAGRRLKPAALTAEQVDQGLDNLEALLPGVPVGSLDLMKASEWARVAADPSRAARSALALRAAFPKADAAAIIRRAPRLALLRSPEEVARDAAAARAMLDPTLGKDDPAAVDAVVELVPELATPKGVANAISIVQRWHPSQDAYELLRKDPTMLLNQDESSLEADPIYGEVTSAG